MDKEEAEAVAQMEFEVCNLLLGLPSHTLTPGALPD